MCVHLSLWFIWNPRHNYFTLQLKQMFSDVNRDIISSLSAGVASVHISFQCVYVCVSVSHFCVFMGSFKDIPWQTTCHPHTLYSSSCILLGVTEHGSQGSVWYPNLGVTAQCEFGTVGKKLHTIYAVFVSIHMPCSAGATPTHGLCLIHLFLFDAVVFDREHKLFPTKWILRSSSSPFVLTIIWLTSCQSALCAKFSTCGHKLLWLHFRFVLYYIVVYLFFQMLFFLNVYYFIFIGILLVTDVSIYSFYTFNY